MAQYHPAGLVSGDKYAELNRRVTPDEYRNTVAFARELGLRLDERRSILW